MDENNKGMNQSSSKNILIILGIILVVGIVSFLIINKKSDNVNVTVNSDNKVKVIDDTKMTNDATELKIEDIVVGTGSEAASGKTITVHYTGTLTDGIKFDSSVDRGTPYTFTLGAGRVIEGWDEGLKGMKIGGKRKLTIPAFMGYGEAGSPPVIPSNATLIFEVELLKVE